jgi:hypothetical protein
MMTSWETCSIDFLNAFVQAKLKEPIWIHLPSGFRMTAGPAKTCLCLIRSQYEISEAPQLWYEHLLKALLDLGLKQCQHDQCLFYKMNLLIVLYTDDAGIAAPEVKYIDEFITCLEMKGFTLTRNEGTFSEVLCMKFTENKDAGTITLTQKGLIKKIISATNMENCNPNWTPAATSALGMDPDSELMTEEWSYPSIVGMLLYLSTNTRPDIAFTVSQVERLGYSPKQFHASAVKQIICYLSHNWDKGTIVKPTNTLQLDCYVDADFAGLYKCDPDAIPTSAKSCPSFIILLGRIPIVWHSQLQSEISLSTLESEYSSLLQAMHTLLLIHSFLMEVAPAIGLQKALVATIHAAKGLRGQQWSLLVGYKPMYYPSHKVFHNGEVTVLKVDTLHQGASGLPHERTCS